MPHDLTSNLLLLDPKDETPLLDDSSLRKDAHHALQQHNLLLEECLKVANHWMDRLTDWTIAPHAAQSSEQAQAVQNTIDEIKTLEHRDKELRAEIASVLDMANHAKQSLMSHGPIKDQSNG
ncbi:hypothetical protein OIO90_005840 [Microbotryomycetes sp. JL221]|nr:hypothetical protein OIO90_005840 [Microbotryomycetes sp. JL221]